MRLPTSDEFAVLEATRLSKTYRGGRQALSNVSLGIRGGSVAALVGPNGAGKSTLIKIWMGFEKPSAGTVSVHGTDPWRNRSTALRVGYVPQQLHLYRSFTVEDHLKYGAHLRSDFDVKSAKRYLRDLGIPGDVRLTALSGGQQAQLMLALALATSASILMLDEPVASLDPLARADFLRLLRSVVNARGGTAVLSSNIVDDVQGMCDSIVILAGGRVLLHDSLADLSASHEVWSSAVVDDIEDVEVVARLTPLSGERLTLVRVERPTSRADGGGVTRRAASLDEVVLGYLAKAKSGQNVV